MTTILLTLTSDPGTSKGILLDVIKNSLEDLGLSVGTNSRHEHLEYSIEIEFNAYQLSKILLAQTILRDARNQQK